jgi:hypothetical protein
VPTISFVSWPNMLFTSSGTCSASDCTFVIMVLSWPNSGSPVVEELLGYSKFTVNKCSFVNVDALMGRRVWQLGN